MQQVHMQWHHVVGKCWMLDSTMRMQNALCAQFDAFILPCVDGMQALLISFAHWSCLAAEWALVSATCCCDSY